MEKIRILIADDHTLVREGTRQRLEREEDFEVVGEAGDGEEAVRLANQLKPDVAIMDVAMPNLNGIEATKQIKESRPATAILVLSAYDNDQYIYAVLEAGANGYLLKNVRGQQLVDAIRDVKRRRGSSRPARRPQGGAMVLVPQPRASASRACPTTSATANSMCSSWRLRA